MSERKNTIFAVSDVHGHYTALVRALAEAGFDAENENHVFLSVGDLFDRGEENRKVYEFVKSLPRKILLRGNHEDNLAAILEGGQLEYEDFRNGTAVTVKEFLGEDAIDEYDCIDLEKHAEKIAEIRAFLDSMGDYYEMRNYVFTHGWLPVDIDLKKRTATVREDWRDSSAEDWIDYHWLEWQQLYAVGAMLPGKIIVCGHRPARMGDSFDPMREPQCDDIFYGDGMIVLDAYTVRSGKVNVLKLEVAD